MIFSERKKDALLVAVYTYSGLVLSFIFSSLFIRFDGGELYGIYAHALAIFSFIVVALGFGFQVGLVKINIPLEKYKSLAMTTMMFWGLIITLGICGYYIMFYKDETAISFLLVVTAGCATLTELTAVVWQWMKRIVTFKGYIVLRSLVNICLVLLLINQLISLQMFLIFLTMFAITHFLFLIFQSGAMPSVSDLFHIQENLSEIKTNLWKQSKFFWASLLAVAVYGKIGIVMLKFFSFSNAEIGRYAYLYTLMAALLILPAAIQTYLLRPLFAKDMDGSAVFKKIVPIYMIIGATCSFLFWKLLPTIITFVIGEAPELTNVYHAFAPTILIVYVANILGMSLMTEGREKERAVVQWSSAITHVLLTIILIPTYNLEGAAMATTGSYFLLLSGFMYITLKHNLWSIRKFAVPLILCAVSAIGFYLYDYILIVPFLIGAGMLITHYLSHKSPLKQH